MGLFRRKQSRLEKLVPALGAMGLERDEAVGEFRALGDSALDTLIAAVRYDDRSTSHLALKASWVREHAVQLLAELDSPRAAEVLLQVLMGEKNSSMVFYAANASCLRLLPHAPDQLLAALGSDQAHLRRNAAQALGALGEKRALEMLITMMQDEGEDVEVRSRSTVALGRLKDPRALAPLVEALEDPELGSSAAAGLGWLGNKAALEPLILALDDESESTRRAAFDALRKLGDDRALEPLISLARREVNKGLRDEIVYAVSQIDPDAADRLRDEIFSAMAAERKAESSFEPAAGDARKGPMGEGYCSEHCYELGGQTVARHQIQGWTGDCSVCRGYLSIGMGQSGSMVCYKPGLFLYFHQGSDCEVAVCAEVAKGNECVVCGNQLAS